MMFSVDMYIMYNDHTLLYYIDIIMMYYCLDQISLLD